MRRRKIFLINTILNISLNILNSKRLKSDFVSLIRDDQVNSTIICASRDFKNGLRTQESCDVSLRGKGSKKGIGLKRERG